MTIEELMAKAEAGQTITDADVEAFKLAEIEARSQQFLAHLKNLDTPDVEPCGNPLCCCNPTFRQQAK